MRLKKVCMTKMSPMSWTLKIPLRRAKKKLLKQLSALSATAGSKERLKRSRFC
jgi:hypothetical protein